MKQQLRKCKVKDKPEIDWYFHEWVVIGQYNEACAVLENCKTGTIRIYLAEDIKFCQGITLQTESESKAIPELSDEEINWEVSRRGWEGVSNEDIFIDGAKWYREQLKQRQ